MILNRVFILTGVVLIVVLILAFGLSKSPTGEVSREKSNIETVSLSEEERRIVTEAISEAEMVSDLPEKDIVAIKFYDYDTREGEKRYRDTFRVTNDGVVSSGKSSVIVYMHSKYIGEFKEKNLCSVVAEALNNGDVKYTSDYGTARLLLKYRNMLKYKDCLG